MAKSSPSIPATRRARTRRIGARTSSLPRNEIGMSHKLGCMLAALAWMVVFAPPASAANKEHQQLMADIRILQEQAQQLQTLIGTLNETLKAVNARLDDQANTNRKSFADQKLTIDNLASDLRIVREKVDDNTVRT